MAKHFAKLEILPLNKTTVFYSPVEGDDVLVRTGTIRDGSFYHSVLHAYSRKYVEMSSSERSDYAKKLRLSLAKLDKAGWLADSDGKTAKRSFKDHFNTLLKDLYKFIGSSDAPKPIAKLLRYLDNTETMGLLTDTLTLEEWETRVIPTVFSKENVKLEMYGKLLKIAVLERYSEILAQFATALTHKKIEHLLKYLKKLVRFMAEMAEHIAFTTYSESVRDVTENVDDESVGLISSRFSRDIYFLDSVSRLPYKLPGGDANNRNRKSIIVMRLDDNHYEIVGRLLPGNKIQREFSPEDMLIRRIYTYLFHPEKLQSMHPELAAYTPKHIRERARSPSVASSSDDSDIAPYSPSYTRRAKSPEGSVIDEDE